MLKKIEEFLLGPELEKWILWFAVAMNIVILVVFVVYFVFPGR